MYIHTYTYTYTCVYICIHIHIYVYTYICYIYIHINTCQGVITHFCVWLTRDSRAAKEGAPLVIQRFVEVMSALKNEHALDLYRYKGEGFQKPGALKRYTVFDIQYMAYSILVHGIWILPKVRTPNIAPNSRALTTRTPTERSANVWKQPGVVCVKEPSGELKRAVLQGVHDTGADWNVLAFKFIVEVFLDARMYLY